MHRYRQIHTTSTKCQYQAAASKPKWWDLEKWDIIVRTKHTSRNVDPINTCAPWNPVATKNVDPKTLSAIVNEATWYSPTWRNVKYAPRITVTIRAWIAFLLFPSVSLWCAHVTVTPDAKRTAVFRSGTLNALIGVIPTGGQQHPNSGDGASLLWKNAQKNAKKKQTSDTMNRIIPYRRPVVTYVLCAPWKVPSRITSRHHWIIERIITTSPAIMHVVVWMWNHEVNPIVNIIAPTADVRGHGLTSTRWKGCRGIVRFFIETFYLEGKCTFYTKNV